MKNEFYEARWWRTDCTFQNTEIALPPEVVEVMGANTAKVPSIVPTGKPEPYNPFDYYFSTEDAQKGKRSLPYLFSDVAPNDPEQLRLFCSRFGVPMSSRYPYWTAWDPVPLLSPRGLLDRMEKIDRGEPWVPPAVSKRVDASILHSLDVRTLQNEWFKFRNFLEAVKSIDSGVLGEGWITNKSKEKELMGWFSPCPQTLDETQRFAEDVLASQCSAMRPRIAWSPLLQSWVWGWESLSLLSLMYFMVGMDLKGQGRLRTCTGCQKFFLASREIKEYCSPECQNRTKAKRYYHEQGKNRRAKKRSASTKEKEGTHGTKRR